MGPELRSARLWCRTNVRSQSLQRYSYVGILTPSSILPCRQPPPLCGASPPCTRSYPRPSGRADSVARSLAAVSWGLRSLLTSWPANHGALTRTLRVRRAMSIPLYHHPAQPHRMQRRDSLSCGLTPCPTLAPGLPREQGTMCWRGRGHTPEQRWHGPCSLHGGECPLYGRDRAGHMLQARYRER